MTSSSSYSRRFVDRIIMLKTISELYEEFINRKDVVEEDEDNSEVDNNSEAVRLDTKKKKKKKENAEKSEEEMAQAQIDYVLVFDNMNEINETFVEYRNLFEKMLVEDGLILTPETCGGLTFIKIYSPVDRLCQEAERVRLEMPLKGCDIPEKESHCCVALINRLKTDDEIDFVSGPFYNDRRHRYEGYDDPNTFFRSALRSFLVHHILINMDMSKKLTSNKFKRNQTIEERRQLDHAKNDIVNRIGLPYMLMRNIYKDAFVPHDISADDPYYLHLKSKSLELYYATVPKLKQDARQELNQTWTKATKFQPLWKVRNYFGEEIALYFAFQGTLITMLWIPAILGMISFVYGLYLTFNEPVCYYTATRVKVEDAYSVNTSSPGITCQTGISALQSIKHDVLDYFQKTFDNKLTPFISLMICIWSALFIEVWHRTNARLSYEWDCDVYEEAEPDRPEFYGTAQIMDPVTKQLAWVYPNAQRMKKYIVNTLVVGCMIIIVFVSVCSVTIIKALLDHGFNCTSYTENGKVDYNDPREGTASCLLFVTCVPTILNSISILILGYFYDRLARKLTRWENHRTWSEHKDALIIKLFAFQFVNTYTSLFYIAFFRPDEHGFQVHGLFGLGKNYVDTCQRGGCMSLLSLQVLSLMILKPLTKLVMDLIWPWIKSNYRRMKQLLRFENQIEDQTLAKSTTVTASQSVLLTENFLEREYLKPRLNDFTLNEYSEKVIEIGYIVMFAASFPIAPLILLLISLLDLRIDARRLLWFNRRPVAYIASDIGMWCPILRFISFCGVISNAFIIAFTSNFCEDFFERADISISERLLVVLVFEHVVFVIMYLLSVIISRIPADIKLAQRRERYEVARILEESKQENDTCKNCGAGKTTGTKDVLWLPTTREDLGFDKTEVVSAPHNIDQMNNRPSSASSNGPRRTVAAWSSKGTKGNKRDREKRKDPSGHSPNVPRHRHTFSTDDDCSAANGESEEAMKNSSTLLYSFDNVAQSK